MSKLLSRYIFKSVASATIVVLLLVVGLDLATAILDQLEDLRGSYNFLQALIYVAYTVPGRVVEYIPLSTLLGCLVGMGGLASSSELVVMRANGLSLFRLAWMALMPVLFFIFLSMLMLQFVAPLTDGFAKTHKDLKRLGSARSLVSTSGLWHLEDRTFMHFNVVQQGGVLFGVSLFDFNQDDELVRRVSARQASYQSEYWLLEDVQETFFLPDHIKAKNNTTLTWETELTPSRLVYLINEPDQLAPSNLMRYVEYLEDQKIDASAFRLAFWQKVLQPLSIVSLVLIALSFIFGPLRSATMGYRVFVGVIVGIAFQFSQNLLGPSSIIYGFSPLFAVAIPIALCALIGSVLLIRAR